MGLSELNYVYGNNGRDEETKVKNPIKCYITESECMETMEKAENKAHGKMKNLLKPPCLSNHLMLGNTPSHGSGAHEKGCTNTDIVEPFDLEPRRLISPAQITLML